MGEPAGIGGELVLKAWRRRGEGVPAFFVIDDADRLDRLDRDLWLKVPIHRLESPAEAAGIFPDALPVLHRPLPVASVPGASIP
jgi:4-hydroxythreonine-4-phosphate dehydrogenase